MTSAAGPGGRPATLLLHELLGRVVVDQSGRRLGRVVDCLAEPSGDELRVTALLVGPSAWADRFGAGDADSGRRVRWQDIIAVSPRITVRERREPG